MQFNNNIETDEEAIAFYEQHLKESINNNTLKSNFNLPGDGSDTVFTDSIITGKIAYDIEQFIPERAMQMLHLYTESSTCSQHSVGAAFFSQDWSICLTGGFNTAPLNQNSCKSLKQFFRKHIDTGEGACYPIRSVHRAVIRDNELHAEDIASRGLIERMKALQLAGTEINLLVTHMPCRNCLDNVIMKLAKQKYNGKHFISRIHVFFIQPWTNSKEDLEYVIKRVSNETRITFNLIGTR